MPSGLRVNAVGACELISPTIGSSVSILHGWIQRNVINADMRARQTTGEHKQLKRESKKL